MLGALFWQVISLPPFYIMKRHGISAIALSDALGVSRNSVSVYRRGFPRVTGNKLNNLLDALNALRRVDTPDIKIEELIECRKGNFEQH
jgi:transcriptional regulator with XRE-family HTH domain